MANMNIFEQDAFSLFNMTQAVNDMQYIPSLVRNMGIYRSRGVTTTTIALERKGTSIQLVQTSPRGSAPEQRIQDKRNIVPMQAVHLAKEATVYADQVQGIRAFGTESETQMVQSLVNQEIGNVRTEIDLTEEHMLLGGLQGVVLDADGSVLYNFFDILGVDEPDAINFALDDDSTKVRQKCTDVKRAMATALQAGGMQFTIGALAGDEFFDNLVNHPDVEESYKYQDAQVNRTDYAFESFQYGGINFINYRGSDDGSVSIAADECRFFPMGVPGMFEVAYAPADMMNTVNTIGLPRYAIPGRDPSGKDKYMSYEIQANPLPYCTRPQALLTGKA